MRASGANHGILQLREAGSATPIAKFTIQPGQVSDKPADLQTVESLLTRPDIWSMDDVERNLESLALDFNLLALGPRRYVARMYRFLLGRWPDPAEFDFYLKDLSKAAISATDIFHILFASDERKRSLVTPLSPFDAKFPFSPSNRHRQAAR